MNDGQEADEQAYIQYLISSIQCPVCHHRYTPNDILNFDHRGDLWIVTISCTECETKGLAFIVVKSEETQTEPFTELTPEELARFKERGAITSDDLLDFYEFLRDYHGDVAGLLGDEA